MSFRVGGALALIAAVLLAVSIATPAWWSGPPTINGKEHSAQEISIGLFGGEGYNTAGESEKKTKILLGGGFKTVAGVEGGAAGLAALLALVLAATALTGKPSRRRFAKLAIASGAAATVLAIALAVMGPDMIKAPAGTTVPLGFAAILGVVGGMATIAGGLLGGRAARVRAIARGPQALGPDPRGLVLGPPPPEPVDILAMLRPDAVVRPPEPIGPGGMLPGPAGPLTPMFGGQPSSMFAPAPQLRPFYEVPGAAGVPMPQTTQPMPMPMPQTTQPMPVAMRPPTAPPPSPPPPVRRAAPPIPRAAPRTGTTPPPFAARATAPRPQPPLGQPAGLLPPPLQLPTPPGLPASPLLPMLPIPQPGILDEEEDDANATAVRGDGHDVPTPASPPAHDLHERERLSDELGVTGELAVGERTDANIPAFSDSTSPNIRVTAEEAAALADSSAGDDLETVALERVSAPQLVTGETVPVERMSASILTSSPRPPALAPIAAAAAAVDDELGAELSGERTTEPSGDRTADDPPAPAPPPLTTAPELPPPQTPPPMQSGPSPACPQCDAPMAWVEQHLRFYCKSCKMYF